MNSSDRRASLLRLSFHYFGDIARPMPSRVRIGPWSRIPKRSRPFRTTTASRISRYCAAFFLPEEADAFCVEADGVAAVDGLCGDPLRGSIRTGAERHDRVDPVLDISAIFAALAADARLLRLGAEILSDEAQLLKVKLILKPPGAIGYGVHQDVPLLTRTERRDETCYVRRDLHRSLHRTERRGRVPAWLSRSLADRAGDCRGSRREHVPVVRPRHRRAGRHPDLRWSQAAPQWR